MSICKLEIQGALNQMGIFNRMRDRRFSLMLTRDEAEVSIKAAELLGTTTSGLFRDATLPKAISTVSEGGDIVDAAELLRTDVYNQRRFTLVVDGNRLVAAMLDLADLVDQDLGDEYKVLATEIRNALNKAKRLDAIVQERKGENKL